MNVQSAPGAPAVSLTINGFRGNILYCDRRYDEVIAQKRATLEMDGNFMLAHLWLGWAYRGKGEMAESLAELQTAVRLSGRGARMLADLGNAYAVAGEREKALAILTELEQRSQHSYVSGQNLAAVYAGLDDRDHALAWLQQAAQQRSTEMMYLDIDPMFDRLRGDPRYVELIRANGLGG